MNAAELRERAITLLTPRWQAPSPEEVARADAWARLAVSAAISETATAPVHHLITSGVTRHGKDAAALLAAVREYAETSDDDGIRTREHILRIVGPTPEEDKAR